MIYTLCCTACLCVYSCFSCDFFFFSQPAHTHLIHQTVGLNENHTLKNPFNVTNCTKYNNHLSLELYIQAFIVWQGNILYIARFCIRMSFSWWAKRGIKHSKQRLPPAADCEIFWHSVVNTITPESQTLAWVRLSLLCMHTRSNGNTLGLIRQLNCINNSNLQFGFVSVKRLHWHCKSHEYNFPAMDDTKHSLTPYLKPN